MRAFTEAILFPLVVTVSSCSTLSGCALAVMCVSAARQTRGHSADAHAAKSLQLLLGFLGQGLLNLLIFSHHSRRPSTDWSSWDLGCGECVRRWCSGTRRNRGSTNSAYQ